MAKKYILAIDPPILNSLEEVMEYMELLRKRDPDLDLETLVVGSYIGEIQENKSFVIRNGQKIRKVKVSPKVEQKEKVEPEVEETVSEETQRKHDCSFCAKPYVRDAMLDGIHTYMCEDHLFVEKEMRNEYP